MKPPKHRIYFITGTDTGVGKTVLTAALARTLHRSGISVAALKPFSSGDRADAILLRNAIGGRLSLDEINPWHFARALAPRVAAAAEGVRVTGRDVIAHVRSMAARHAITLVEGAGGLLSPLAADADADGLIAELGAVPIVVCGNRLGAINQTLLVLRALPVVAARRARVVLVRQSRPDHSAASNLRYLRQSLGSRRVFELPRLLRDQLAGRGGIPAAMRRTLRAILGNPGSEALR